MKAQYMLPRTVDTIGSKAVVQKIVSATLNRVGVVFSGRQSPGGHNVIWGLHCAIKINNPNSVLLGFLGGSEGLFAPKTMGGQKIKLVPDGLVITGGRQYTSSWTSMYGVCDIKHRCCAACRNICCCKMPHKVLASIAANTWVVSGSPQTEKLQDILPSIIHQLDNLENLKKLAEQFQKQVLVQPQHKK